MSIDDIVEEFWGRWNPKWGNIYIQFPVFDEEVLEREMKSDLMEIVREARKEYSVNQSDKYIELLMAVENKYPNESRHDTALRLIREAQKGSVEARKEGN